MVRDLQLVISVAIEHAQCIQAKIEKGQWLHLGRDRYRNLFARLVA